MVCDRLASTGTVSWEDTREYQARTLEISQSPTIAPALRAVTERGQDKITDFRPGPARARIYLMFEKDDPSRSAGEDGGRRILHTMMGLACLPDPGIFATAEAQPGWASYPMSDTWTDQSFVDGVVLIGDAAGYNDFILGQGPSIAVRDVRLVAEALLAEPDWSPTTFAGHATERTERMRAASARQRRP